MCPMKTFQLRTRYAPWLTDDMKDIMKKRDELHKKAVQTKCPWKQYKTSWGCVGPSSAIVWAVGGGLRMLIRFKLALFNYQCFFRFNKL